MKKLALLTLAIFFSVVLSAQIQTVKSYSIANSNTQIGAILPAGTTIYNVADDVNYRLLIPSVATYTLNTAGFAERVDEYAIGLTETNADSLAVHLDTLQAHNTAINLKAPKESPTFTGTVTVGDSLKFIASDGDNGSLSIDTYDKLVFNDFSRIHLNRIVAFPNQTNIVSGDLEGGIQVGYLSEEGEGVFLGDYDEVFNNTHIKIEDYFQHVSTFAGSKITSTTPNVIFEATNGTDYASFEPADITIGTVSNGTYLNINSGNEEIRLNTPITTATGNFFVDQEEMDLGITGDGYYLGIEGTWGIAGTEYETSITSVDEITLTSGTTTITGDLNLTATNPQINSDNGYIAKYTTATEKYTYADGQIEYDPNENWVKLLNDDLEGAYFGETMSKIYCQNSVEIGDISGADAGTKINIDASDDEITLTGATTEITGDITVNGKISITGTGQGVFIGENAGLVNPTSGQNVFIGYDSGKTNSIGGGNTAVGTGSLQTNLNGSSNTSIGYFSLNQNTSGAENSFLGYFAGRYNTEGRDNTVSGYSAFITNTTGSYNTASGAYSLYQNTDGTYNTASGTNSLSGNTSGSYNSAIGDNSLSRNSTGSYNAAIGYLSGKFYGSATSSNQTGAYNVFLGYDTRANANADTNEVVIGANAIGNGDNSVTLGDDLVTDIYMNENGDASVHAGMYKLSALNTAPANATATGTLGEIRVTASYIYVCTATNTWVRSSLATW